jgi:hypothetical protein
MADSEDLYDALVAAGIRGSDEARLALCDSLVAVGFTAGDLQSLRASVGTSGRDPAALLASILADAEGALARARQSRRPESREPDHVRACGDVVARSVQQEAAARGESVDDVEARRLDADVHAALAYDRRRASCSGRCEEREQKPACCVPEWLRRQGRPGWTGAQVWEAARRHCARDPEEPWTVERLLRRQEAALVMKPRTAARATLEASSNG